MPNKWLNIYKWEGIKNSYSCCKVPVGDTVLLRLGGIGPMSWLFIRFLLHLQVTQFRPRSCVNSTRKTAPIEQKNAGCIISYPKSKCTKNSQNFYDIPDFTENPQTNNQWPWKTKISRCIISSTFHK